MEDNAPASAAANLVNSAIQTSANTMQAWDGLYTDTIAPDSGLWFAMNQLAIVLFLAAVVALFFTPKGAAAVREGNIQAIGGLLIWPLIVVFFIGSGGGVLANVNLGIRQFARVQIDTVLQIQMGELTLQQAIEQVQLNGTAMSELQRIYGECVPLTGAERQECLVSKQSEAEELLAGIESERNVALDAASNVLDTLENLTILDEGATALFQGSDGIARIIADELIPIIQLILSGFQWAFVNFLEAAIWLTMHLSQPAMALSILPIAGRPIIIWGTGLLSLFSMQLGYNLVVGAVAEVMVRAESEVASSLGFSILLSIAAPFLIVGISSWGGTQFYRGISNAAGNVAGIATRGARMIGGR